MSKVVVTVTGPSASGKTELVNYLCKNDNFKKLVSITTRQPREGEEEGVEYYFVDEDDFKKYESEKKLVQSVTFNGKFYATTSDEITKVFDTKGIPIVIVEPGGVDQFKRAGEELGFIVFSIFVYAPYSVLKNRFIKRLNGATMTEYDETRLQAIEKEAATWWDSRTWDICVGNGGSDMSDIGWVAKQVVIALEDEMSNCG
jgi:guanylate kinase